MMTMKTIFRSSNAATEAFDDNLNAAIDRKIAGNIGKNSVSGILNLVRFHKNNFLIGMLDNNISVKGSMVSPQIGMEYVFTGKWVKHPKYGESFSFTEYKTSYPKDLTAIRSYLAENCKWIGPEISKKLVNMFGEKTLDICKNDPDRVSSEISGITPKRAQEITTMLKDGEAGENVQLELKKILAGIRVSKRATSKILEAYKHEAPEKIRKSPYRLIDDIDGIGFLTADEIAMKVGFDKFGKPRICAGIIHILKEGSMSGNTGLPFSELVSKAHTLLGFADRRITDVIKSLVEKKVLACRKLAKEKGLYDLYCLKKLYEQEKSIAVKLQELLHGNSFISASEPSLNDLAIDQKEAIQEAVKSKVFILTGAPGVGKTFLIERIINSFPEGTKIILAAPTGKAARRMTEQSGKEAMTIHRLLEPEIYSEPNKEPEFRFTRNSCNPINADLIILDESSMIDVPLMASFINAVSPETRLIMVGDTYQLPSVGPGNILKDMINAGLIPTTELTIIKRQDEGLIIKNCHKIKNGKNIELENSTAKDFFFLKRKDERSIKETIIDLVIKRLPQAYNADSLKDIQIISPLREKTGLSCKCLNKTCQEMLNSSPKLDKILFKIGDKVIQTKNDYETGIINGDIGYIRSINLGERTIYVDFKNPGRLIEIPLYGNNLELAYSLTCHKFQGSETRIVIIPIHKSFGPLIMQRNWLYTAISRAKEACILVGQREEIPKIIKRNKQQKRFTNLEAFLKEEHARKKQNEERDRFNVLKMAEEYKKAIEKSKAEQPKKKAQKHNLLEQAILVLADDCDGAVSEDGIGFNKYDSDLGHELAYIIQIRENNGSPLGRLFFDEYEEAYYMLRKYRGQLMDNGIDYERITPKPIRKKKNNAKKPF
jgi:exodeoxyribonuclease V alpha subunit